MKRAGNLVIALFGLTLVIGGCASSSDVETDHPPQDQDSTPEPDRENLRNILREKGD